MFKNGFCVVTSESRPPDSRTVTSESSKAEETPTPQATALGPDEGNPPSPQPEAEALIELVEPPIVLLACENLDSIMTPVRLQSLLESCNRGCTLVIPQPGERRHCFDSLRLETAIPNVVMSSQFFKLGISLPLHPFILKIMDFFFI